jgi:hypothetical protein
MKKMTKRKSLPKASRSFSRRTGMERKLLTRMRARKRRKRLRKTTRKSSQKKKLWKKKRNQKLKARLRMLRRRSTNFSLSQMEKDQSGRTLR